MFDVARPLKAIAQCEDCRHFASESEKFLKNRFLYLSKQESQTRGTRGRFVRPAMLFGNFQITNI